MNFRRIITIGTELAVDIAIGGLVSYGFNNHLVNPTINYFASSEHLDGNHPSLEGVFSLPIVIQELGLYFYNNHGNQIAVATGATLSAIGNLTSDEIEWWPGKGIQLGVNLACNLTYKAVPVIKDTLVDTASRFMQTLTRGFGTFRQQPANSSTSTVAAQQEQTQQHDGLRHRTPHRSH